MEIFIMGGGPLGPKSHKQIVNISLAQLEPSLANWLNLYANKLISLVIGHII